MNFTLTVAEAIALGGNSIDQVDATLAIMPDVETPAGAFASWVSTQAAPCLGGNPHLAVEVTGHQAILWLVTTLTPEDVSTLLREYQHECWDLQIGDDWWELIDLSEQPMAGPHPARYILAEGAHWPIA